MPKEDMPSKLYWAKANRFQLGGFMKEQRNQQGMIVAEDQSIDFTEHIYATDNPKKQKYIEESRAFRAGRIKLCEDEKQAAIFTEAHDSVRAGVVKVENLMDRDVYSRHS